MKAYILLSSGEKQQKSFSKASQYYTPADRDGDSQRTSKYKKENNIEKKNTPAISNFFFDLFHIVSKSSVNQQRNRSIILLFGPLFHSIRLQFSQSL